jgi:hypothetical protein
VHRAPESEGKRFAGRGGGKLREHDYKGREEFAIREVGERYKVHDSSIEQAYFVEG